MWRKHAHTLATLIELCYTKVKFKWTDVEKNSFMVMNKIGGKYSMPSCPNFSEEFIIYIYAIQMQIRGVIIQNRKPVSFYLDELTTAQNNYKTI